MTRKTYHHIYYLNHKKQIKDYIQNNRKRIRLRNARYLLKKTFGFTDRQCSKIMKAKRGKCAICKHKETTRGNNGLIKRLSVDHNHITGQIRGLICQRCNRLIGGLRIDKDLILLNNIIKYVRKFS